jgi:hypothetical protein
MEHTGEEKTGLDAQVGALGVKVGAVEAQVGVLGAQVGALQKQVDEGFGRNDADIRELRGEISSLRTLMIELFVGFFVALIGADALRLIGG